MKPRPTPIGFDLYDLFTVVVPGALLVLTIIVNSYPAPVNSVSSISSSVALIFLLASFTVGGGIDLMRVQIFPAPNHFRQVLYSETGNKDFLGRVDKLKLRYPSIQKLPFAAVERNTVYYNTDGSFWETFKSQYDLDDGFKSVRDIYNILISEMEPKMSSQVRRYRTWYLFIENIFLSAIGSLLICMYSIITNIAVDLLFTVLFVVLLFAAILTIGTIFFPIEPVYVDTLITEYFATRRQESSLRE